jgi:histidyl-tRNA synthetase
MKSDNTKQTSKRSDKKSTKSNSFISSDKLLSDKLVPAKGMTDWYSNQAILREWIKSTLKEVFEEFGFVPLETPEVENLDVLTFKGGQEIQKEIYKVVDQGERDLGLRFDHTVPLARFVASNKDIRYPFRRYSIGTVFRNGPSQPKQGRYRAFTQCDVDILGITESYAEIELILLAKRAFQRLNLGDIEISLNNRKILNGILNSLEITSSATISLILIAFDKLDKIGLTGVKKELENLLSQKRISSTSFEKLIFLLKLGINSSDGTLSNNETLNEISKEFADEPLTSEGINEIKSILSFFEQNDKKLLKFEPALARGLDYYTGTVMEVFLKDKSIIKSAILGGGRYDNMIGSFRGTGEIIPAVGFSFGVERISTVLESMGLAKKSSNSQVIVYPESFYDDALRLASKLRYSGLKVEFELKPKKLSKTLDYAQNALIPFVLVCRESKDSEGQKMEFILRDITKREQATIKEEEILNILTEKLAKINKQKQLA